MTWDKSKNTYTDEQLKEILEQHKLWLSMGIYGEGGRKANLSSAILVRVDLTGVNLMQANLTGANLTGANLTGANLTGANLTGANLTGVDLTRANLMMANLTRANFTRADLMMTELTGADLTGANFTRADLTKNQLENTMNWQYAIGMPPEFTSILQPTELQEKQNQIQRLEQELQQAKQEIEKDKENAQQVEKLQNELSQAKQERDDLEDQLEAKLDENIENAQDALATSLTSADNRIQEYSKNARWIGRGAIGLITLDLVVIIYLIFRHDVFFNLLKEVGAWTLTLYSFPILIVFSIAITLFRHQKKLLDEVRYYSAEKRQIELYSGLLKASQYSAKSLNDPEQSANYVHETFDKIRDRILSEQPHTNTAGSAVEQEEYSSSLEPLIKVISEMIAKGETKK